MKEIEYEFEQTNNVTQSEEIVFVPERRKDGSEEKAIEFSKKVLAFLEEEVKNFNSKNDKRIKLSQARKMYCLGARLQSENKEHTINEWGLARVNLFLRIIAGNIEELNLDISKKTSYNKLMDITDHLIPSTDDLLKAKQDSIDHDLDYHYEDIEELYIEEPSGSYYIDYS